jgi:hypothetical protein
VAPKKILPPCAVLQAGRAERVDPAECWDYLQGSVAVRPDGTIVTCGYTQGAFPDTMASTSGMPDPFVTEIRVE